MTTIQEFLATQGVASANGSSKASTDAAIMAVPYALDPIRLVGDEDKHATILHFGETSTLPSDAKDILLDILVQVAKNSSPFSERIISVSRLGSDNPPALVAMLSNRFLEQIRNSLQVSPQVRDYLTNMQQYPQFTPHVTLGYPDYQGETELRQTVSPLGRIHFDRLSLWWNGERFDVPLMDTMSEPCDSAEAGWGEDVVSDFLAHYGVKGMKWKDVKAHPDAAVQNLGNSNAPANASFHNSILRPKPGQVAHDSKAPKADVDWAKKKATVENLSKVANKSHSEFQNQFRELLKSPRFQEVAALIKARKNDPASAQNPKVIAFFKQAKKIHDDIWEKNSAETFGQSPSKGYKLVAVRHPDGTVTSQMVKTKSAFSKPSKSVPTDVTKGPRKMQHDDLVSNFLVHFGVKGMRWGMTKKVYNASAPVLKTLLDDQDPTNVDRPISPEHSSGSSGITSNGAHYQSYKAGSNSNGFRYTKYSTGEKSFFRSNDPQELEGFISSSGRLLNSREELKAYGGSGKLMQHDDVVSEFLEHHGIKGMRWGISKEKGGGGSSSSSKVNHAKREAIGHALADMGGRLSGLKNSPKYKGKDLTKNPKLRASYDREVKAQFKQSLEKAAKATAISAVLAGSVVLLTPVVGGALAGAGVLGTVTTVRSVTGDPGVPGQAAYAGFGISQTEISHADTTWYTLLAQFDAQGFVTKLDYAENEMQHDGMIGNFLAHFGIKGMRWGIRRERGPGGTVESGVKLHEDNSFEIPSLHKMPVGSVAAIHTGESSPKLMKKREDGRWEETHLSADAERFAKTRSKAQHELSDREINEATKRAEAIRKYNELFNPPHNPNQELADKVAAMELQSKYAKLHSELHPSFGTKVSRFVKNNEKLFSSAVGALSGPTGKKLTDYIKQSLEPGIQAVANQSTTTHPKQSTTKGTSVAKQTATLPLHGNGPHSNPSHSASPPPKRNILGRKKKPKPFDPKAFK